jgi:hypothetical protein
MAGPNPYRAPKDFGFITIGGFTVPGVVQSINGADKPEVFLVQMGIQVSHGILLWRGTKLAEEIIITTNLPNAAAYDAYVDLRNKLRPKIGKKPPSFSIANAIINFAKIQRVTCRDMKAPVPTEGLSWLGEINLAEYSPPRPANIGPADPPKAETENDRLAARVETLVTESKKFPLP